MNAVLSSNSGDQLLLIYCILYSYLHQLFANANKEMIFSPYWPLFNVGSEIFKVDDWTKKERCDNSKCVSRNRMSIDNQYKGQKAKQFTTKNYTEKKDWARGIPLNKSSGMICRSCSFICTRRVTVVLGTSTCK